MEPNSNAEKGTVYINGEPISEVGEIKIPLEVEPSDFPPILKDFSITFTIDCPKWLRRKLLWWRIKSWFKALAGIILQWLRLNKFEN